MCSLVVLKRVGALLTGLGFAILVAGSGNAADLPRRTNAKEFKRFLTERREAVPASAEARKKLFDEFLEWRASADRGAVGLWPRVPVPVRPDINTSSATRLTYE
jgi:hypothetical protein